MSYLIRFKAELFRLKEFGKVVWRYWRNPKFAWVHLRLILKYIGHDPFHMSRDTYGETPLTTLDSLCREFNVAPGSKVYELGSGRGVTSLWLRHILKCDVIAVEFVPEFIDKAKCFEDSKLKFIEADFTEIEFEKCDYIYLYGTCLDEASIKKVASNIPECEGIITTSYALSDFSPQFELKSRLKVPFEWGEGIAYLTQRAQLADETPQSG